jgi:hypothetical protein
MKIFSIFSLVCVFCFSAYSAPIKQYSAIDIVDDEPTLSERWQKALGTFQFEILEGRELTQIDISVIDRIESVRHQSEVKYFMYSDRIRVKVLPNSMLKNGNPNLELRVFVKEFKSK